MERTPPGTVSHVVAARVKGDIELRRNKRLLECTIVSFYTHGGSLLTLAYRNMNHMGNMTAYKFNDRVELLRMADILGILKTELK